MTASIRPVYDEELPPSGDPADAGQPGTDYRNRQMPRCDVLAGEFLDNGDFNTVPSRDRGEPPGFRNDQYFEDYVRGMGTDSKRWSWHAYGDPYTGERRPRNGQEPRRSRSTRRLAAFLRSIPSDAKVWLTEQGGQVHLHQQDDRGTIQAPAVHENRADADLRFILEDLATLDTRISRLYVYQWQGNAGAGGFDSGPIRPTLPPGAGPDAREETRGMYDTFYEKACPFESGLPGQPPVQSCDP